MKENQNLITMSGADRERLYENHPCPRCGQSVYLSSRQCGMMNTASNDSHGCPELFAAKIDNSHTEQKIEDDRTEAQRLSHPNLIVGTDSFMSGWGGSEGGLSYAAWACEDDDLHKVQQWVEGRGDQKRVRYVRESKGKPYRPRKGCAHLHIYVVTDGHPALN